MIEVNIDNTNHSASLKVKVFSDDMLSALKGEDENLRFDVDLLGAYKNEINSYFKSHLSILANGVQRKLTMEDITQENDTHWIEFRVEVPKEINGLTLKTDMLTELFPTQSNIVSISLDDDKEYYRLSKSNTSCSYKSTQD